LIEINDGTICIEQVLVHALIAAWRRHL